MKKETTELYADGLRHIANEQYDAALGCFRRILDDAPGDQQSWYQRGIVLFNMDRYEDAVAAFKRALELEYSDARAWAGKGDAHFAAGEYEDARNCYDRSISFDGDRAETYYMLSRTLMKRGSYLAAVKSLTKAKELASYYALRAARERDFRPLIRTRQFLKLINMANFRDQELSWEELQDILDRDMSAELVAYEPTIFRELVEEWVLHWHRQHEDLPFDRLFASDFYRFLAKFVHEEFGSETRVHPLTALVRDIIHGMLSAAVTLELPVEDAVKYVAVGLIVLSPFTEDGALTDLGYLVGQEVALSGLLIGYSIMEATLGLGKAALAVYMYGKAYPHLDHFGTLETALAVKKALFKGLWDALIHTYRSPNLAQNAVNAFSAGFGMEETVVVDQLGKTDSGKITLAHMESDMDLEMAMDRDTDLEVDVDMDLDLDVDGSSKVGGTDRLDGQ